MRILADTWYARELPDAVPLDTVLPGWARRVAGRFGPARGVLLVLAGRRAEVIVTTNAAPGATTAIVLCGLLGSRKLVLLEYILRRPARRAVARWIYFLLLRRILLRRALLRAQVLSAAEAARYPVLHGLPASRFVLVRWPARTDDAPLPALAGGRRVLASGRLVDWPTFLTAAAGSDWQAQAVCTTTDLDTVLAGGITVRCDIPAEDHQAEVAAATVYVIAVPETGGSIGQIRVMNAVQAGVPIVASDVSGLRDYLDSSCAVLVPPGDPVALRRAVDALLDDPDRRDTLRRNARQRTTTMRDYLDDIGRLVDLSAPAGSPDPVGER